MASGPALSRLTEDRSLVVISFITNLWRAEEDLLVKPNGKLWQPSLRLAESYFFFLLYLHVNLHFCFVNLFFVLSN